MSPLRKAIKRTNLKIRFYHSSIGSADFQRLQPLGQEQKRDENQNTNFSEQAHIMWRKRYKYLFLKLILN